MSFPDDLLKQARHLAKVDARRPKQVNLRRSVSASYYALFHLLTSSASSLFASDAELRARINRSFNHGDMKRVSQMIAHGKWPESITLPTMASSVNPDLEKLEFVADAFVKLQQARHEADYDLSRTYSREEADDAIERAAGAFERWEEIKKTDYARLYLACFLLYKHWDRER